MKTAIVALALVVGVATAASSLGQQPAAVSDTSGRDVPQFFSTAFLEKLFPSIALQTGENAYLVSDYFCDFVMSEPERFFRVTVKYPKEFAWWLDRLPDLSFTDYGGCDTSQECHRAGMIANLERFEPSDPAVRAQHKQLVDRLTGITIRHVN